MGFGMSETASSVINMTRADMQRLVDPEPQSEAMEGLLSEIRKRLVDRWGTVISQIILYGSRAQGHAQAESDFDLLIVYSGETPRREARRRFRHALGELRPFVDLQVVTEPQFHAGQRVVGCLAEAAARRGRVLHAR
jgi:predicted nucleotidyltransferase